MGDNCVAAKTQALMEKAAELLREASEAAYGANSIEDRMYGAKPCDATEKQAEPNSLEDILTHALYRARDARQTLERINSKL